MSVGLRVALAACMGVFYGWMAINFWGVYVINSPIHEWLLDVFARRGHQGLYLFGIYTHDVIVNVLLAAPIAAIFVMLRSMNRWPMLLVAVASGVAFSFRDADWSSLYLAFASWGFWFGAGVSALSLPAAFMGIRAFAGKGSVQNSCS